MSRRASDCCWSAEVARVCRSHAGWRDLAQTLEELVIALDAGPVLQDEINLAGRGLPVEDPEIELLDETPVFRLRGGEA